MNSPLLKSFKRSGFTLVELIVVITILAILGTLWFISLQWYASRTRDTVRLSDISTISKAIDIIITKRWSVPLPENGVIFTGGSISITSGLASNLTIEGLSTNISDPVSKVPYNYAVFWSSTYYQVGTNFENNTQVSFDHFWVDSAYANTLWVSKLVGNYKFNSSLPSLFPIAQTISSASGGVYSSEACFILDNLSTNSFGSNAWSCTRVKDLNLGIYNSALVAHWDMETLSWSVLRDLSGNGYDAVFTGWLTYAGSLSGGMVGRGISFRGASGSGEYLQISKGIPEQVSPQFSMLALIRLDNVASLRSGVWWYYWTDSCATCNLHVEFISPAELRVRFGWINKNDIRFSEVWKFIQLGFTFNGAKVIVYVNGKKIDEMSGNVGTVFGSSTLTPSHFIWNSHVYPGQNRPFEWVIDDIKIFNQALSPWEIIQNMKIMGF